MYCIDLDYNRVDDAIINPFIQCKKNNYYLRQPSYLQKVKKYLI